VTTFKPGQRVKIFYCADGGYKLGTIIKTDYLDYYGLAIEPDEFKGKFWQLDDFRTELVEGVEV